MSLTISSVFFIALIFAVNACTLNIDISLGNPWISNDNGFRVVNLIISNTGTTPITSAEIQFSFEDPSYSISQLWGLDLVSNKVYSLSNSPNIVVGSPLNVGVIVQTTNPSANSEIIVFDQSSVSVIQVNGQTCYTGSSSSSTTTGLVCQQPVLSLQNSLVNNWQAFDQYGNQLYYYQVSSTITNGGTTTLTNVQVLSPTAGDIVSFWGIDTVGTCNPNPVCVYEIPSYAVIQPGQTYSFGSIFGLIVPETDIQDLFYLDYNPCSELIYE